MEIIAYIAVSLGLLSLLWMGWIDLKLWILPNELVALLAVMAPLFHYATGWAYGGWLFFMVGALVGGGSLWLIRAVANRIYGMDTLGFGDIKLMAAAGLWLGPEAVLMAMSVGAMCGVLHAFFIVMYQRFVAGIIIVLFWMYKDLL